MVRSAERPACALWVGVLGPLLLEVAGQPVSVPGAKRQAVLALLAQASPHPISTDRLVDALWPDEPPTSGRTALQNHVSRLRRHLGPAAGRLASTNAGYQLDLRADELDADRAATLLDDARAWAARDPSRAAAMLTDALGLWRGAALAGLADTAAVTGWARLLNETWLAISDLLVECSLATDDHTTALRVAAEALVAEPLREAGVLLAVRALAAAGSDVEALRVAHDFRRRLAEETGLDPSPALAAVEHAVAAGRAHPADGDLEPQEPVPVVPIPVDELLGRGAQLAAIARLLATERLVTLLGPGGVGKTRLALELAQRASAGQPVTVLHLAPVTDSAAIAEVLASSLGLRAAAGDLVDRCALRLRPGRQLLVVDNCEHLLPAARGLVVRLLEACPGLTVLATSRERLAIPAEQVSRVAPLSTPEVARSDVAAEVPSVALFLARARRVHAGLEPDADEMDDICRIVRRLDGLPLAIELAAGRLSSMTVTDLHHRLDRALDLLGETGMDAAPARAGDRHRGLRAAIEWSYDLLPDGEQRLFRHLAVFPDGFDLATAEHIAADLDDTGAIGDPGLALAHLVDTSMLVASLDGVPRYRMLETLRAFGLDRLAATGEDVRATEQFLGWVTELVEWIDRTERSDDEPAADRRLRAEAGNLRAAWQIARETGNLDLATTIVLRLYYTVAWRDAIEAWAWARELADDPRLVTHPAAAAVTAMAAEGTWFSTGDLDQAEELARRGLDLAGPDDEEGRVMCLWSLGEVLMFRGRHHEAIDLFLEAAGGERQRGYSLLMAGLTAVYDGDLASAADLVAQARHHDLSPTFRGFAHYVTGEREAATGQWDAAERSYRDALDLAAVTGATFLEGIASVGLVSVQAAAGDTDSALRGYRALIDYWERTGGWTQQWTTLRNLADLLDDLGDNEAASHLRAAADQAPEAATISDPSTSREPADMPDGDRGAVLVAARAAIAHQLSTLSAT